MRTTELGEQGRQRAERKKARVTGQKINEGMGKEGSMWGHGDDRELYSKDFIRHSRRGAVETNPTRNHEGVGSTCDFSQ